MKMLYTGIPTHVDFRFESAFLRLNVEGSSAFLLPANAVSVLITRGVTLA